MGERLRLGAADGCEGCEVDGSTVLIVGVTVLGPYDGSIVSKGVVGRCDDGDTDGI